MVKAIAPDLSETLYTPIGSELTITDPANRKTKQQKDAFGRLTAATNPESGETLPLPFSASHCTSPNC